MGIRFKALGRLLRAAVMNWRKDKARQLAAALAYYSIFSLAPLLMLGVALAGMLAGREAPREVMLNSLARVFGGQTEALEPILDSVARPRSGIWATLIGLVLMFIGASGVFLQLQEALDTIWGAPLRRSGLSAYVRRRAFSVLFVLLVLLLLLIVPAATSRLADFLGRSRIWDFFIALSVETVLFASLFKFLPDARVLWREVWPGALLTACLFSLGQEVLALYLVRFGAKSVYGAAGSLVALLIWIYTSAQILLFGAEFIQAYCGRKK